MRTLLEGRLPCCGRPVMFKFVSGVLTICISTSGFLVRFSSFRSLPFMSLAVKGPCNFLMCGLIGLPPILHYSW